MVGAVKSGLVPNSQWTMWVANGADTAPPLIHWPVTDEDMYSRSRAAGRGVWPPTSALTSPDGSCMLSMHTSPSVHGPWTPYTNATITPCGGNNPAPWVHPNGTVYLVVTDQDMGLYSAPTWAGPYTLVTSGACGGGEDPSLWVDPDTGAFHCMFHRSPFSNPDIAIGHAYSLDGFTWYAAADAAANSSIAYDSGFHTVVHGKRERPHPYFVKDATTGRTHIGAFVSGVCITPECNPLAPSHMVPGADCSSATQYHHCDANSPGPGWYDRTYTLVQLVGTQPAYDCRPGRQMRDHHAGNDTECRESVDEVYVRSVVTPCTK